AGLGGKGGVCRPLDIAIPLARREDDGEFLQVLRYGALETQLRAHGSEMARGLRAVQHGAKLQADRRRVAVVADAVVDLLAFGVELLTVHVRDTCHARSPLR